MNNKLFWQRYYKGTITTKEANIDQSDLLVEILNYRKQVTSGKSREKQKKEDVLKNL